MDINNNGQYSLFGEEESQLYDKLLSNQNQNNDLVILQNVDFDSLFKLFDGRGTYTPIPKDKNLWESGQLYYKNNIDQVRKYLTASGLTKEIIEVVLADYGNALLGNYSFSASVNTMIETLNKTNFAAAFIIEKYGFYRLLLLQYYNISKTTIDYTDNIKNADNDTKINYIDTLPTANYRALGWAIQFGYVRPADFPHVPTAKFARFFDNVRRVSELFDYGQYYHLCKALYLATPEQLATINPPKALKSIEAQGYTNFAEEFYKYCQSELIKATERYTDPMDSSKTPQEREKALARAENWNPTTTIELVKISKNLNAIMQRPIEAREIYKTQTLTIRKHIEEFLSKPQNQRYNNGLITEGLLQRAIGGLDLMRSVLSYRVVELTKTNTVYSFENISISKFSELCGFKDANQREKLALYGCLQLLKDIYIRVEIPYKVRKTKKGKKVTDGGELFVQVANIPNFSVKDGRIDKFTIQLTANDLGGELIPITATTHKLLQNNAQGPSERRFQAQLLGRRPQGNKNENDLVDDCFGFSERLKEAENAPEAKREQAIRKEKAYIQGHQAEARKKIKGWFDKYQRLGVITYTASKNTAGEIVYKWRQVEKIEAPGAKTKAAHLITDAEIIEDEQGAEQPNATQNDNENA